MADYEVGVRLVARDETGPGTSSAEAHLKGVDTAAKGANKEMEGMGAAAKKGADQAAPALNGLKNSLGDIAKMAIGFSIGGIINQLGGGLTGAIQESVGQAKEFYGQVKQLQMVTGGTAEETSSMVSAFERFGVSSDRAAASISLFARQIQKVPIDVNELASGIDEATGKPLKGFADVMHDMGIQTEDSQGKVRDMTEILMDTADKFKAMGNGGEAASRAITLFGRAGRDMLPLLMQGREGIRAAAEEAAKFGLQLTTQNMAQIKAFSNANKDLNEAMSGLKLQIGIALMPVLTALAQVGAKLAEIFNQNLMPVIRTVSDWIAKMVGNVRDAWSRFMEWLGPLGRIVDVLKDFVANVIDAVANNEKLQITLTNTGIAIGGATVAMAGFGAIADAAANTVGFLGNAISGLNAIFEAGTKGTVVLIIVALAAALITLYQTVPQVTDIFNAFWEAITGDPGALGVIYDVIRDTFGPEAADRLNPFLNWFMKAIPLIKDLVNALAVAFTDDAGAMGVVYDVIQKLFGTKVADFFQPFLQNVMLLIPRLKEIGPILGWAFEDLRRGDIRNVLIDLGMAFGKLTGIDMSGFAQTVGRIFDTISRLWDQFSKDPSGAFRAAWAEIQKILEPLAPSFNNLKDAFEKIAGAIQSLWPTPLKDVLDALGNADFSGVGPSVNAATLAFQGLYGVFLLLAGIINTITGFFDWIVTNVGNATQFIKDHKEAQAALVTVLGALGGVALLAIVRLTLMAAAELAASGVTGILTAAMWAWLTVTELISTATAILDALLLSNPIGIIIVAIAALVALIIWAYNNVDWFRDAVNNLWKALQDWYAWFSTELQRELTALGEAFNRLGTFVSENGDTIKTVLELLLGPPGLLLIAWQKDFGGIQEKVQSFIDFMQTVPGIISGIADRIGSAFSGLGTKIHDALMNISFDIGPFHWKQGVFSSDIPGIGSLADAAGGAVSAAGQQMGTNATSSYSLVGELAGGPTPQQAGLLITGQSGGWLREPIQGVGPSGTRYQLHANEYVSPSGTLAEGAAAAHRGGGGGAITLTVESGAVQISGANGPAQDWAAAADGLWDDLYAKLSRALDNRVQGQGAY